MNVKKKKNVTIKANALLTVPPCRVMAVVRRRRISGDFCVAPFVVAVPMAAGEVVGSIMLSMNGIGIGIERWRYRSKYSCV